MEELRDWKVNRGDIRRDPGIAREILEFIEKHRVLSVAMTDAIIGCPHQKEWTTKANGVQFASFGTDEIALRGRGSTNFCADSGDAYFFLLKNSHVWPGCRRAQMVCFRAVGAHGRARCSIALRAMTRLKFSSAIRLRNFRDLILIGGGHPSLISSRSRSQRQIDMAVTPNSFCTCEP